MLNVYVHPDRVRYEDDPTLLRFSEGKWGGEVCVFLEYLPQTTRELLKVATSLHGVVTLQEAENVADGTRTLTITYGKENVK